MAVARELNFTRAAESCHVAQPSLTRAVKQLEDEFGGELFRRERNLSHLTELGHRMLPLMQQCYDSAQTAKTMAHSIKAGAVAPFSVALSVAINLAMLVPFLTELVRALPGLELRFQRGTHQAVSELLKKGEVEVAVSSSLGETWDRLESWVLFSEPYSLVAGQIHPLAVKKTVAPGELAKQRLLCRSYCEHNAEISVFLKTHNASNILKHQVAAEHDLAELLLAGFGVGIAPVSSVAATGISHLDVEGLDLKRTVSVYAVSGRQRSTAASTFIKMLRAADWSDYEKPVAKSAQPKGKSESGKA